MARWIYGDRSDRRATLTHPHKKTSSLQRQQHTRSRQVAVMTRRVMKWRSTLRTHERKHPCARIHARMFRLETVVDEMEYLVNEYAIQKFVIQDENITYQMERIEEVADEIIKRKLKISWYPEAGALIARLNPRLIEKMARSGVMAINMPVESGDPAILKKMSKPLKLSKVKPIVDACREHGVRVRSFLLLGLPGESVAQMEKTRDFAREIGFDWNFISLLQPLPGTAVYEELVAQGVDLSNYEVERFIVPPIYREDLSGEELLRIRDAFNLDLNFENNFNLAKGDLAVALKDFTEISVRYSNVSHIHHFLGLASYKNSDLRGAQEAFEKAVKTGPSPYNSSDWVEAIRQHRASANDETGYLDTFIEDRLGYRYGHLMKGDRLNHQVKDMLYNVAALEETHGGGVV